MYPAPAGTHRCSGQAQSHSAQRPLNLLINSQTPLLNPPWGSSRAVGHPAAPSKGSCCDYLERSPPCFISWKTICIDANVVSPQPRWTTQMRGYRSWDEYAHARFTVVLTEHIAYFGGKQWDFDLFQWRGLYNLSSLISSLCLNSDLTCRMV